MSKSVLLSFILLNIGFINAQYTEIINSNNPGYSETPYVVGTNVFQVENDLTYLYTKPEPDSENNHFENILDLRQGFFLEELEFNLQFKYKVNSFEGVSNNFTESNFEPFGIGAKYLLYNHKVKDKSQEIKSWKQRTSFNWSRAIPSVSVATRYSSNHRFGGKTFGIGVLLQNELNPYWNIISNFYYEGVGNNSEACILILTSSLILNDKLAIYGENRNIINKQEDMFELSSGFTYLVNRDLQLYASFKTRKIEDDLFIGFGTGVAWRLDRHKDKFTDKEPSESKNTKISKGKTSSRIKKAINSSKKSVKKAFRKTGDFFRKIFSKK